MKAAAGFGRYTPLLAILAVQALLVMTAPTPHSSSVATGVGAGGTESGAFGSGAGGSQSVAAGGGSAGSTGAPGGALGGSGTASIGSAGGAGSAAGSGIAGSSGAGTSGGGGGYRVAGNGVGPCVPIKKITFYMPSCNPTWSGGNNGGATMTGVTSTEIRYVYFVTQSNAQVNAILAQDNLTATPEQTCEALQAWNTFVNKYWQLYGRKFVSLDGPGANAGSTQQSPCHFPYFQSQCSSSPPDPTCYRAEADTIAAMKPAFVLTPSVDTSLDYRLAQDHILTIGTYDAGPIIPEQYYDQLAPYLYGLNNGTQQAQMFAEFWCKDLAGKPVQWAGESVEHPNGNPLSTPPIRKLMIFYSEGYSGDPTDQISADYLQSLVTGGECGKPGDAITEGYSSDITTGAEQSNTSVATAEADHITDITCFCDPIAPAVSSTTFEDQNYQPEFPLLGNGLLDYDPLAQLYNQDVWRHAFGLSNLGDAQPFAETDAVAAWQAVGNSGEPDQTENLSLDYFETMADDAEVAGPDLNPTTIHNGLLNAPPLGGDPFHPLAKYTSQFPWDSFQDVRLVYYCPTQTSATNGRPGAYIPLYNGQRFKLGQIPSNAPFFPNGLCAP